MSRVAQVTGVLREGIWLTERVSGKGESPNTAESGYKDVTPWKMNYNVSQMRQVG